MQDVSLSRLRASRHELAIRQRDAWLAQSKAWRDYAMARDELTQVTNALQEERCRQDELWDNYRSDRLDNQTRLKQLDRRQRMSAKILGRIFRSSLNQAEKINVETVQEASRDSREHVLVTEESFSKRKLLVKNSQSSKRLAQDSATQIRLLKRKREKLRLLCEALMLDYQKLQTEFQEAKEKYVKANAAFQARFHELEESGMNEESARAIAEQAGVPAEYLDKVFVKRAPVSTRYDIYFGGVGEPVGPGHGHYCMIGGRLVYARNPESLLSNP